MQWATQRVLAHLGWMTIAATTAACGGGTSSSTGPNGGNGFGQPSGSNVGAPCSDDAQCTGGYCDAGTCQAYPQPVPGRPLVVAGERKTAELSDGCAWSAGSSAGSSPGSTSDGAIADASLLAQLRRDALDEHASIPAFARTVLELVALGAPAELVRGTTEAQADEIRHAEGFVAWIHRLGGEHVQPGRLPASVAPHASVEELPAKLLADVFEGGCVGETLAAHDLAERAARTDGALGRFFHETAEDETRHAALAFKTARWLAATFGLERELMQHWDAFVDRAPPATRSLVEPLLEAAFGEVGRAS